jgi:hypothetical protein
MIYINLTLRNPWSDKFEHVRAWDGRLFKHKAWEVEIYRSDTVAEVEAKVSVCEDHAGVTLGLGLFSYTLRAQFYDTRHWNYAKKEWQTYEENLL